MIFSTRRHVCGQSKSKMARFMGATASGPRYPGPFARPSLRTFSQHNLKGACIRSVAPLYGFGVRTVWHMDYAPVSHRLVEQMYGSQQRKAFCY